MSKKMLINATHPEENRVAIVENGILTELGIEVAGREPTKGNIYKAAVVRVEPGLQAAFVDYGAERLGFLQIDEINPSVVKPGFKESGKPRINDLLHRGQEILVQIGKEERGTKGAALTTYLSLAGRYMVLMPGTPTRGVSRKAEDDKQRKLMKKALSSLDLPENVGCIVRTAALDQTREELERDYQYLMRLFENIETLEKKVKAPALLYKESNLVIRSIRDYFTTDMDEVLIDDPEVYREAREFFEVVMPDHIGLVKLHQERRPIFSRYQIEEQIETISRNKVALPSGGSIVIDTTEALVAIDVNSGKMAGETNVESTATRTNLEAAEEVARQLRLRDLGGLIVIDFIDMRDRKHNRQVEDRLKEATARDKARITIGHISQFGMLEMSRQRIKPAMTEGAFRICPHCQGAGQIRSVETLAVSVLRRLHAGLAKGQVAEAEAQMAREVASFLLNEKREELLEMERRYQADIQITGRTSFLADQVEIILSKREKEKAAAEYIEARVSAMPDKLPRPAENEAAESIPGAEVVSDAAEEAVKKKRKRRRKKKSDDEGAAAGVEARAEEPGEELTQASGVELAQAEPLAAPAETPARKKRRRRKKSGTAKDPAAATEPRNEALAEELTQAGDEMLHPVAQPAPPAEVPTRRKRRRKKKSGSDVVSEVASATVGDTVAEFALHTSGEKLPAMELAAAPEAPSAKKMQRQRGRKQQAVEATAPLPASEPSTAAEMPQSGSSPDTAETMSEKTRKNSRRTPKQPTAPTGDANAAAATAQPAPLTDAVLSNEKPRPKRIPRKQAAPDTSSSPVETTAAGEKPARKRTPRRKADE